MYNYGILSLINGDCLNIICEYAESKKPIHISISNTKKHYRKVPNRFSKYHTKKLFVIVFLSKFKVSVSYFKITLDTPNLHSDSSCSMR